MFQDFFKEEHDEIHQMALRVFIAFQDALHDSIIMRISRLSDDPFFSGKKTKPNISLAQLIYLFNQMKGADQPIQSLYENFKTNAKNIELFRNRVVGHRDKNTVFLEPKIDIEPTAINNRAIEIARKILDLVWQQFNPSDGQSLIPSPNHYADSLIHHLRLAKKITETVSINIESVKKGDKDLRYAHLIGADLKFDNLSGADLSNANLSESDLFQADLSNANLCNADLRVAYLCEANLSHADLSGANLYEADLSRAKLTGARHNAKTIWPLGFNPPPSI